MKNFPAFTIYNAAAGAGKTYTLVKNYLTIILDDNSKGKYKQILAVTFTNKAVSEMKQRILDNLYGFSLPKIPKQNESMFLEIQQHLELEPEALKEKAKGILHFLLHNYTSFSVQTIDKFTQSVIKTFAFDLGLSKNFQVELDQQIILEKAIDKLLLEVGKNKELSKIVVNYAKTKIDDDRSWNIKKSLLEIAKIIFNENDIPYIKELSIHSLHEFGIFKKELFHRKVNNQNKIQDTSGNILGIIEEKGIQNSFNRNSIPKHFQKLQKEFTDTYTAAWKQSIGTTDFYTKKTDDADKAAIDLLRPKIEEVFKELKFLVHENLILDAILKNLTQMSLIKSINDELELTKKEEQIILISDFNKLIFEQVKNQPTPFIYERLGERYKHFFIDEFQDTSIMQWQNLLPLCDNAVSSLLENQEKTGTVSVVGDAKQAIYRWRGGKAEQLIELFENNSPFSNPEKEKIPLNTNYRSCANIIDFNNAFFTNLATSFANEMYSNLYFEGSKQHKNNKEGGYVEFSFIEAKNKQEKDLLYPEQVLAKINLAKQNGFDYRDITVLVRKNQESLVVAEYMQKHKIPVLSAESLLIKNCEEVTFLIAFLEFVEINDTSKKLEFLKSAFHFIDEVNYHDYLTANLKGDFEELVSFFLQKGIVINTTIFDQMPFYEAMEFTLRNFNLIGSSNANLQFFMDVVFEFSQKENSGITSFLSYWNSKKDKLSVVVPQGENAVQIMSIHKSKGLEFPIVIYPFADTEIYDTKRDSIWLPLSNFNIELDNAYLNFNKTTFQNYNSESNKIVEQLFQQKELDNFNLLYVAFTRAKEQLYVISNQKKDSKNNFPEGSFPFYFKEFLENSRLFESNEQGSFYFGNQIRALNNVELNSEVAYSFDFDSINKAQLGVQTVTFSKKNTDTQLRSIERGLEIHNIMAQIKTISDVKNVLYSKALLIDSDYLDALEITIKTIMENDILKDCFNWRNEIYCEREFLLEGEFLRPDRIEITPEKKVYIIDYKTGSEKKEHEIQVEKYAQIFNKMGYETTVKCLIYLNNQVKIREF